MWPRSRIWRTRPHRWRRAWGSRPVVGSSRKRTRGSLTSAAAMLKRCFCPPESGPHLRARLLGQLDVGEQLLRVHAAPVEVAEELEQLDQVELVEEARRLELDPDAGLHPARILADVDAVHDRAAGVDGAHPLDHLQGRRLARPVGAEDPEHLALGDLEADPVHGLERAVALPQVVHQHDRPGGALVVGRVGGEPAGHGGGMVLKHRLATRGARRATGRPDR